MTTPVIWNPDDASLPLGIERRGWKSIKDADGFDKDICVVVLESLGKTDSFVAAARNYLIHGNKRGKTGQLPAAVLVRTDDAEDTALARYFDQFIRFSEEALTAFETSLAPDRARAEATSRGPGWQGAPQDALVAPDEADHASMVANWALDMDADLIRDWMHGGVSMWRWPLSRLGLTDEQITVIESDIRVEDAFYRALEARVDSIQAVDQLYHRLAVAGTKVAPGPAGISPAPLVEIVDDVFSKTLDELRVRVMHAIQELTSAAFGLTEGLRLVMVGPQYLLTSAPLRARGGGEARERPTPLDARGVLAETRIIDLLPELKQSDQRPELADQASATNPIGGVKVRWDPGTKEILLAIETVYGSGPEHQPQRFLKLSDQAGAVIRKRLSGGKAALTNEDMMSMSRWREIFVEFEPDS